MPNLGWISSSPTTPLSCKQLQCPDPREIFKGKAKWNCMKPKSVSFDTFLD